MKNHLELARILLKISLLFGLLCNFYIKAEENESPEFKKLPNGKDQIASLDERMSKVELENQLYKTEISLLKTKLDDGISSISKLEVETVKQKSENTILKTKIAEDSEEIQKLKHRISILEAITLTNCSKREDKDHVLDLKKRPARLLPLQLLFGNRNDSEEIDQKLPSRFVGPPTNCSELGMLGYTLNGYYLVKKIYPSKRKKIDIIYCTFRQEKMLMNKQVLQTPVGTIEVNTTSVYFHGCLTENYSKDILLFRKRIVNIGGGLNDWNFTAPVSGTYHFIFYGTILNPSSNFMLCPTINGLAGEFIHLPCPNCSTQSLYFAGTYHLKAGGAFWLYKYGNSSTGTVAGGKWHQPHSHLLGWLLEED